MRRSLLKAFRGIFEVKEAGYYYLNMRYKQSELINGQSARRLEN